jgi:hypothetical protein
MTPFQKWLLWGSSIATAVTGVVYWWMKELMEPMSEWAVINHPLQPWVLKAHIIVAPVMVLAVGTIALDHVWKHYRSKVNRARRSGTMTMWVVGPMVFSGYLIQAVTHAGWLTAMVWVHLVTGVLYCVGLAAHKLALRRRRSTASDPAAPTASHRRELAGSPGRVP